MKKKEYKSVTYGMRYEQYVKILNKQLRLVKDCKGFEDLNEDVKVLKKTKNCGLPSLLASIWMKRICEMDKEQLIKFVNTYKKGDLDPYQCGQTPDFTSNTEEEEEEL